MIPVRLRIAEEPRPHALGVVATSQIEDRHAVVVSDPQRLAGSADAPAGAIEAAVRRPAQDESGGRGEVGPKYLMTVARVQVTHTPAQAAPRRVKV
jgi:hypothetical protein